MIEYIGTSCCTPALGTPLVNPTIDGLPVNSLCFNWNSIKLSFNVPPNSPDLIAQFS